MPSSGTRLGPYEIMSPIGSGGMGEVWKAKDTTLNRDVALKFLPDSFAADPDRLARFQREAIVLASLNHPNIASIYGVEQGTLVLELVEGPTLADRLVHGPLPVDEALAIARQIAEALEAAHAQGIVHRDLKPANIKVRPDGTVKVLDFGLAKAFEPTASTDLSLSPTMTSPAMTRMGVILGTAAYMSPEQARAATVDSRTDVWSFGVVLYEMLTGDRLFDGPTMSDTLAAVLRADLDWRRLPADLPPAVARLLRRCLQRDVKRRVQHMGDVRVELEDLRDAPVEAAASLPMRRRWPLVAAASVMSALLAGALVWIFKPAPPTSSASTHFIVRTPGDEPVGRDSPLAISPDGRHLAYGTGFGTHARLVHQSLDSVDAQVLEGTADGGMPAFLPKGDAISFFDRATGQLRRAPLTGGSVTKLFDAPDLIGASWGTDGTIVFDSNWGTPLKIVRAGGSAIANLTRIESTSSGHAHIWPQILPGNRAALFTIWAGAPSWDEADIAVADLATGQYKVVLHGGSYGRYASSGHLVFWRSNGLMAVRFDLQSLEVKGEPVKVVPDVRLYAKSGSAHFALSENGTLAYVKGRADHFAESFIADRSASRVIRLDESESSGDAAFSPDGTRVASAVSRRDVHDRCLRRAPQTADAVRAHGRQRRRRMDEERRPCGVPVECRG